MTGHEVPPVFFLLRGQNALQNHSQKNYYRKIIKTDVIYDASASVLSLRLCNCTNCIKRLTRDRHFLEKKRKMRETEVAEIKDRVVQVNKTLTRVLKLRDACNRRCET